MDRLETKPISPVIGDHTPQRMKTGKKRQEQNSAQQATSVSLPGLPDGLKGVASGNDKLGTTDKEIDEGERLEPRPKNDTPPATDGWRNQQYIHGNNDSGDGEVTDRQRDELVRELKRIQELGQPEETLQNRLGEGSMPAERVALRVQAELEKERARSQELELIVRGLRAKLLGSGSRIQDRATLDELEDESSVKKKAATELRQLLNEERESRETECAEAEQRLAKVEEEKQQLDTQYKALLGRVAHIKTTLSDKLKSDAEELNRIRSMVANLEEENHGLHSIIHDLKVDLEKTKAEGDRTSEELSTVRSRLSLSQQNWAKERNDFTNVENYFREEYAAAKQAMQEWEIIATEERSVRESLGDRVIELEEQLANNQAAYDELLLEKNKESSIVDGLRSALNEIQNTRRQELRDVVESTDAQIKQLTSNGQVLAKRAKDAESQLLSAKRDLERVLPFEGEVKEKNLLIGKLRHEAVTLNDHLRKALRMLKRDNADDKIDKNLVTNVLLQFVSIQRGDSKKYEILQLIASVLDWNEEQREKAGLVRPGTTSVSQNSFLKTPSLSPFHRSPSTPTLNDAYEGSRDLWTSVLDSERP